MESRINDSEVQDSKPLEIALEYLNRNGFITRLHKLVCDDLSQKPINTVNNHNFVLDLEIDLQDLLEFNGDFYNKIVSSPQEYISLFRDAVNAELISKYTHSLISCELLVSTTKPFISEHNLRDVRNGVLSFFADHVLTAICIREEHSPMLNKCFGNNCTNYLSPDIDDNYASGMSKLHESFSETRKNLRAEKISALFMDSKAFKFEVRAMYTAIKCNLQEPLIKYLELGCQYHIWGYYSFDYPGEAEYELLGLEKINPYSIPFQLNYLPPKIQLIQSSLQDMFPDSPWAFVNYLALQFGHDDWMLRSYLSLRTALLLSLATLGEDTPVPILCTGSQPIQATKLMNEISKPALRRICQCTSLQGTIGKSGNNVCIRSGKLTMAAFGVSLLGDWEALKSADAKEISSVIREKKVCLGTENAKLSRPVPKVLTLPLKTAIWTYLYYEENNKHLQNLTSEFGIPIVAEPKATTFERYYSAAKEKATDFVFLSMAEMSQFLQYVNSRTVDLTDEAAQLINDYILMCRRTRGNSFPLCVADTLTALAKGHARLSLREEVTYDDVLIVIFFYEESWYHIYGNGSATHLRESPRIYEQMEIFHKDMATFKENTEKNLSF